MIAGPAGSGKATFATQFIAEGIRKNEPVVVAVFEEYPEEYLARARARNQQLQGSEEQGALRIIYLRPLDLSVDEMLSEILDAVNAIGAQRVVIDSLSGFEIALAPAFREDFRESLYRLIGALTATGVTVFMTAETTTESGLGWVSTERISFITDDVVIQRVIEIDGELRKVLAVLKMRGSAHSHALHAYDVNEKGAAVHGPFRDGHHLDPDTHWRDSSTHYGLTANEAVVLDALVTAGRTSAASLGRELGMDVGPLKRALERIVALGYGSAEDTDGDGRWYLAVRQPAG
jgi:circadian clock protein KaiC